MEICIQVVALFPDVLEGFGLYMSAGEGVFVGGVGIEQIQQRQMRIQLRDIIVMFEKIQEEMNIAYVSVVVFCAVDVDSLCTLKILSKLFKSENVQYMVYPVTRYTELFTRIEESKVYDQVRLFIFVNCGGILDLSQSDLLQRNQPTLMLFDSNKPIHHKNLESPYIKVIDDGSNALDNCPTSEEIEKYQELDEYDLEEEQGGDDEDEEPGDGSPKRRNKRVFKEKLRKHKEIIGQKIEGYYTKSFFGYPSSYSAYRLVRDLGKANNDYLWYGVVGMTSMYLQRKLGKQALETLTESYKLDVLKFNGKDGRRDRGDVAVKRAYHFPLLDHWSLYDSMFHSHYLTTKLALWEDRGLTRLHELIHTLGISLDIAKQLYKYMPLDQQRKLDSNIFIAAEKFGLHEVTFMSFVRHVDCSAALMASDYYYILTAMLESAPLGLAYQELYDHRVKSFWQAYDIFEGNYKELAGAMESYKKLAKIFVTESRNILQRDHLVITNNLSLANIKGDTDDRKLFQHPSALMRIANLLMDITIQRKKDRISKPMVAIWIDLEREICQVVGVMADPKNSIGNRFNKVAQNLKIDVDHDNFMSNIMLLQKDHITNFVNEIIKMP